MKNKHLKIKEGLIVNLPFTPNYLIDHNEKEVHPIEGLTDAELEYVGEKWKEELILSARKKRNKNR